HAARALQAECAKTACLVIHIGSAFAYTGSLSSSRDGGKPRPLEKHQGHRSQWQRAVGRPARTSACQGADPLRQLRLLFNGKDLTGWKTLPDQKRNWTVKDGNLVGSGNPGGRLYTERAGTDRPRCGVALGRRRRSFPEHTSTTATQSHNTTQT